MLNALTVLENTVKEDLFRDKMYEFDVSTLKSDI